MKLGIISDTHDNVEQIKKAVAIFKDKHVDKVIHCGDIIAPFTIQFFKGIPITFVKGNCDGDIAMIEGKVKEINANFFISYYEFEADGKRIIAVHGKNKQQLEKIIKSQNYDYVLYGHTHQKDDKKEGKTRIINPGAHYPTIKNKTIAILNIENDNLEFIEVS